MAFFIRVVTSSLTCLKTIEGKVNLKLSNKQEDGKSGIRNFAPLPFHHRLRQKETSFRKEEKKAGLRGREERVMSHAAKDQDRPLLQASAVPEPGGSTEIPEGSYYRGGLGARVPELHRQNQDGTDKKIESSQLIKDRRIRTRKIGFKGWPVILRPKALCKIS